MMMKRMGERDSKLFNSTLIPTDGTRPRRPALMPVQTAVQVPEPSLRPGPSQSARDPESFPLTGT